MSSEPDYSKLLLKKSWDELTRIPNDQETLDKAWDGLKTKWTSLSLGVGTDGECRVSQEQRENHFHLLGTTGEGKSMLLLRMMMEDIKRNRTEKGPGFVFIDGSETGQTLKNVLGYCEKIGFKKVILIDPDSRFRFNKLAPLNPIHTDASLVQKSVSQLTEAFRVVFSVKDPATTAYIENYLPAFFRVLATAGCTLNDLKYFLDYENGEAGREKIANLSTDWDSVSKLRFAYKNTAIYLKEVGSTMRRLGPIFRDEGLSQILTHRQGLDFAKLIADRWIVLVDLSEMDVLPGRLLSSLVINEVIFGLKRLRNHDWKGYEYLYIDEAARYATSQIADILDYRRQIGLRLVLSHQHMGQLDDSPDLAKAIKVNAKSKVAFYIADREERDKAVRMMYGGDLEDRQVSYVLSQQEKQNAVVKLGKQPPRVIKIHDTPVYKVSGTYLKQLFSSPWYYTKQEIKQDTYDRFTRTNTVRPEGVAQPKQPAPGKPDRSKKEHTSSSPDESKKEKSSGRKTSAKPNVAWDNLFVQDKGKEDGGGTK